MNSPQQDSTEYCIRQYVAAINTDIPRRSNNRAVGSIRRYIQAMNRRFQPSSSGKMSIVLAQSPYTAHNLIPKFGAAFAHWPQRNGYIPPSVRVLVNTICRDLRYLGRAQVATTLQDADTLLDRGIILVDVLSSQDLRKTESPHLQEKVYREQNALAKVLVEVLGQHACDGGEDINVVCLGREARKFADQVLQGAWEELRGAWKRGMQISHATHPAYVYKIRQMHGRAHAAKLSRKHSSHAVQALVDAFADAI